jgi:PKD repeat protein
MSEQSITSRATRALLFSILLFALPAAAHASVVISEVMYDPEGADTGREWVELYNDGADDVALVGGTGKGSWRISDNANHSITDPSGGVGRGSLVVPAGGYLVLASDPAAFMAEYSGDYSVAKASLSFNNTGATVSLVDGSGATVDSATYSASQGGDGNGASLQLSSGAWLQALPTPGAANATEAYAPPEAEKGSGSSGASKSPSTYYVAPPAPAVFADAGEDRTVIVGADAMFRAQAYNRDRAAFKSAKFVWNFGDGVSAEGAQVMHHFSYPGRYSVELHITNQNYSASSKVIVTAKEAAVAMAELPGGGVSIRNGADRDLDLSYWLVRQGAATFRLPEHSIALKGGAINIDQATLGFAASGAKLLYPNGAEVALSAAAPGSAPEAGAAPAPVSAPLIEPDSASDEDAQALSSISMSIEEPMQAPAAGQAAPAATSSAAQVHDGLAPTELAAAAGASGAALPLWTALAGLGGIMGLGVAGVLAARRKPGTDEEPAPSAEEFTIE